jgi:rare lipoprotein A (peptidoglycan hydrolase)
VYFDVLAARSLCRRCRWPCPVNEHKTAPCGTLITFTYAGRSLTVPLIDRGPYIAGRESDLTGATAAALAFPGLGQIQWSVAR